MLDKLKYIILGIIQGLTEPLPISSSGHLVIFKNLFNLASLNDLNFEIIVNFASFLAIIFIYRKIKGTLDYKKEKHEQGSVYTTKPSEEENPFDSEDGEVIDVDYKDVK